MISIRPLQYFPTHNCSAEVSGATREWRLILQQKKGKTGQPAVQCYSRAKFQVEDRFFCKRHAEMRCLELLLGAPINELTRTLPKNSKRRSKAQVNALHAMSSTQRAKLVSK